MSLDFLFLNVLGSKGIIGLVGILIFCVCLYFSDELFDWVERQTFGARDHILSQCELLFFKVNPDYVTYLLLALTVGNAAILFSAFTLLGSIIVGIGAAITVMILGWQVPKPIIAFFIQRRKEKFQNQMVDGLNLMSGGLRAGQSLPQSMGMIVQELPKPISEEFNLVLQQNRLGMSLEESLENMNQRLKLEDVEMLVSSISILRETGGNLSETFDTISEIIRERVRLQQKISKLVAQNKIQGIILCSMPFVMLGIFSLSDPQLVGKMFTSTIGLIGFFVSVGLVLLGAFFIVKIVKIKA